MRSKDVQRGPQTIPRYELLCFCCEVSHTPRLLFSGVSRNETAFSVSTTIRKRSRVFAHGLGFLQLVTRMHTPVGQIDWGSLRLHAYSGNAREAYHGSASNPEASLKQTEGKLRKTDV